MRAKKNLSGVEKNTNNRAMKVLKIILLIIAIVLFAQVAFITYMLGINQKIYKGVYVYGIALEGMSRKEAQACLEQELGKKVLNRKIRIYYSDEYEKKVEVEALIQNIDFNAIARDAQRIGREGRLIDRYMEVISLRRFPKEVEMSFKEDITKLRKLVYEIKDELDREKVDAKITKEPNKDFVITKDVTGVEVLIQETVENIIDLISKSDFREDLEIAVIVNEDKPKYSREYYLAFTNLLGEFSTPYSIYATSRNKNLQTAASKINGTILQPNEIFSTNDKIGPTTIANGYAIGQIISNGRLINGVGGGVCQVSSTLYNAVLYAELEVVERRNHSLPVAYVSLGRDATLSGTAIDLKFKNNSNLPIYIESYLDNGRIYVKIYGSAKHKKADRLDLTYKVVRTIPKLAEKITYDSSLQPGQRVIDVRGYTGYVVELYGAYYKNNQLLKNEHISTSNYRATAPQVRVGPEKIISPEVTQGMGEETSIGETE